MKYGLGLVFNPRVLFLLAAVASIVTQVFFIFANSSNGVVATVIVST